MAAFLGAATLADSLGIEGIVGAFFAGLGLNRLVPNEGPLMDRIDFFGAAVFVPIFLVSVGMLLDPTVMIAGRDPEARRTVHRRGDRRQDAGRWQSPGLRLGYAPPRRR